VYFREHGPLAGAEVDDAVGDHDIGPAVFDREVFGQAFAELDLI